MNIISTKQADRDMDRYYLRGVKEWGFGVAASLQILIGYTLKELTCGALCNRYIGYRFYKTANVTKAFYTYPLNGSTLSKKKIHAFATSLGVNFSPTVSISLKKKPFTLVLAMEPSQKATNTAVLMGVYYGKMDIEGRLQRKGIIIDRANISGYKVCSVRRNSWAHKPLETQLNHALFCLDNKRSVPLDLRRSLLKSGYRIIERHTRLTYGRVVVEKFIIDMDGYEIR
jgi:hypothetical protein